MTAPLPSVLAPITIPMSWLYGRVIASRNRRFDRGDGVTRLDLPVISVGNVTVGGSGKTPMVRWIATQLLAMNITPVIAMRGYGARPGEIGDEEAEYRDLLPDVPVAANPNRIDALREVLDQRTDIGCVILDDGFQHRQIARDLDVVLVDATRHALDGHLLPAGLLREPSSSLARADAVVLTRSGDDDARVIDLITRRHGRAPIARTAHSWTTLTVHAADGEATSVGTAWLEGRRVATMLGVGHPESIARQIEAAGATIAARIAVADHERYDAVRLTQARSVCEGLDALIVTRKDWVKVREVLDWRDWTSSSTPLVVPELTIGFHSGDDDLRSLVGAVVRHPVS